MSCYSIPKRLMHIVFGGSAIWLGTTFCSPLAATELDLPPAPVVMPETLETPTHNPQASMVPAASLDEVSHWDNGPVLEDEVYNEGDTSEDEFCWESDCGYDYAEGQEALLGEVAEEVESEAANEAEAGWCYENDCCDKYAFDGYEPDAPVAEEADGVVDLPENAVYSDLETPSEQYGYDYDYDDWYAHEESINANEKIQPESDGYVYESEDDFDYEDEWMADYEQGAIEAEGVKQPAAGSRDYATDMYEDYWYDEEYAYDYEDGYDKSEIGGMDEQPAEVVSTADAEVQEAVEEEDFSYEFDDYEMYYGYEEERAELAEQVADSEEIVDDATESRDSDWEDYYYEDEYEYYHDEYESGSQSIANEVDVDEAMESEAVAEETWADEHESDSYEYDYYEYDYYDYEYGMESADAADVSTDESLESWDAPYDYQDPMDQYGDEYDVSGESAHEGESESGEVATDLFTWQPSQLLRDADLQLIRSIEQLSDQPAAERRTCLNSHIEVLGFEAIDFAYRYEDATDSDVLVLADDLPGAAAFLACYRLVEQGRIGMDDGILLLQTALSGLSLDWIEEVGQIASPKEVVLEPHPVVRALLAASDQAVTSASALSDAVSQQLSEMPWTELQGRLKEIRAAFRPLGTEHISTF